MCLSIPTCSKLEGQILQIPNHWKTHGPHNTCNVFCVDIPQDRSSDLIPVCGNIVQIFAKPCADMAIRKVCLYPSHYSLMILSTIHIYSEPVESAPICSYARSFLHHMWPTTNERFSMNFYTLSTTYLQACAQQIVVTIISLMKCSTKSSTFCS